MKGAVKRNTFPSTGRWERETSWTASPDSVETICGSGFAENSIIHQNVASSSETEKRHGGDHCRPQFYLSLEGYCFSRSCEGG
jgi:hypothetical protein